MISRTGSHAPRTNASPLSRRFAAPSTEPLTDLDRDFNEFVQYFIAHEVRFLVVGGYALAAHGLPQDVADVVRLTGDSDVS